MLKLNTEFDVANDFSEFFKEKIKNYTRTLNDPHVVIDNNNKWEDQQMFKTELTEFKSLIEDEFRIKSNISIKHIEITVATQLVNNLIWKII